MTNQEAIELLEDNYQMSNNIMLKVALDMAMDALDNTKGDNIIRLLNLLVDEYNNLKCGTIDECKSCTLYRPLGDKTTVCDLMIKFRCDTRMLR